MTKSILIVEDELNFRNILKLSFERLGYKVTDIAREREYITFKNRHFDYVILDLQLENGNTFSLIPLIKRHHPECKILILTGFGTVTAAVQAIKLGADNFIHKPATTSKILEAIEGTKGENPTESSTPPTLAEQEREYIEYVLQRCSGNISKAARELGIHRQSLQRKLKSYVPHRSLD